MRTTLTRLLCLLWLCLAYLPAHAQTETPSSSMDSLPTRYKWEVATDLLWLLDKNTMPATSIFIRRHTEKGAWRLRVGGSYKTKYSEPQTPPNVTGFVKEAYESRVSMFSIRTGYEWHKTFKFLAFYYGGDLMVNYTLEKGNDFYPISQAGITQGYNAKITSKTTQLGGVLFLGVKKHFSPKISVSGEMGAWVSYDYQKYRKDIYEYPVDDINSTTWQYYTIANFQMAFQPLYVLNLSYHF